MNGWENSETWLAVLWGFSDHLDANEDPVRSILRDSDLSQKERIVMIADSLEEYFYEFINMTVPIKARQTIVGDFIETSVSRINWYEIAEKWYEDNVTDDMLYDEESDDTDE